MKKKPEVAAALAFLLAAVLAPDARAQQERSEDANLGRLYRRARIDALAERFARRRLAPMPPVRLRTPRLDSLRAWVAPATTREHPEKSPAPPVPRIRERRAVLPLGRPVFKRRFAGVDWAYLGRTTGRRTVLDTMKTRRLRARLQGHYGDPTRTVVDADTLEGRPASEYVQFEYWFVANDSIPLKVVDPGGPFDRGLVFSAPARYRERLAELREDFFAPLIAARLRAPYVDYYYDTASGTWYRTGFDGRRFFTEPVDRSDVVPGRRPALRRERSDAGP